MKTDIQHALDTGLICESMLTPEEVFEAKLDDADKAYAEQHDLSFEDMFYFKAEMQAEAEAEALNKIRIAVRDAYPIVD